MNNVELNLDAGGRGSFFISEKGEWIAEMEIAVKDGELTVYHTEVAPEYEDKGLAKLLLSYMVEYARTENLKVVPLCRFVLVQFKRNPAEYNDVWKNS